MTSEYEILYQIRKEILRYIGFTKKKEYGSEQIFFFETFSGEKNFYMHRYSMALPKSEERLPLNFSSTTTDSTILQTSDKNSFPLDKIFFCLYEQFKQSSLVRIFNNNPEIHISVLKQFLLDCCVSFQIFLSMLLAPTNNKEWTNIEDFLRTLEAANQKNVFRGFFSQSQDKKLSTMMRIQKFLFFFCVVEFECKQMNLGGLVKVMEFVHRMQKTKENELIALARNFLTRADTRRKEAKSYITFHEFKALLLNSAF